MSLTAVILAGGRGRRLGGVVKPLITRADGRTLLRSIETCLAGSVDDILVSATAATRDALESETSRRLVIDPGGGPAEALGVAAQTVVTDWILLVGGDHTAPDATAIGPLVGAANPNCQAVAYELGVRLQPLWALYRTKAVHEAASGPPGLGGESISRLLAALDPVRLDGGPFQRVFDNLNTAEDARRLGIRLP